MSQPADQDNRSRPRVVLPATDRSQSIIGEIVDGQSQTIAYSAYGEQSAQQKIETRLGFNGQLREANIGWYLLGNGYRAYNPRLMRFHSPDSWSPFRGGGLNAYMYCVGDPVNRVDPTGHFWEVIKLFVRENIRYRTPQKLAIANVKANARYKAMSTLGRSSRPDSPSPPSRQDTARSQIGGFIMGAPGPRNRVPSRGGDIAPQNVGGWESQNGGTPWRVSRTAQDGPSFKSPSRPGPSSSGGPSNFYDQKYGSSFSKSKSSPDVELKPLFVPGSNNAPANNAASDAYRIHVAHQKYHDAQLPGPPPSYAQVTQEMAMENIRKAGKK